MKDLKGIVIQLRARIKRKRSEVQEYLDRQFYDRCRNVLQLVEKIDSSEYFKRSPSSLPDYSLYVHRPMFWDCVRRKLQNYNYSSVSEFTDDMRLVIDNGYAYNGFTSVVSIVCRDIELVMEDLFIKELNVLPPNISELRRMGTKLSADISKEIWRTICFYEKKDEKTAAAKTSISLTQCRTATLRRIREIMECVESRRKQKQKIRDNVTKRSSSTIDKVPVQPQRLAAKEAANSSETPEREKQLKEDSPAAILERVPQNARSYNFTVREISPVHMEDEGISSDQHSTGDSPTFAAE